jgi:hypothetical protein
MVGFSDWCVKVLVYKKRKSSNVAETEKQRYGHACDGKGYLEKGCRRRKTKRSWAARDESAERDQGVLGKGYS